MAKKFNLKSALENAARKFGKTVSKQVAEGGTPEFDDGRYQVQCLGFEIGESKSGRVQAVGSFKFLNGDYKGQIKKSFQGLDSADGYTYFFRDLDRLGYDVSEIEDYAEDVPAILKQIGKDKPMANITLITKGDFQNLRINSLLEPDDVEEADDDEEEDEDTPKKKSKHAKEDAEEDAEEDDDEEEDDEEDVPAKKKNKKKPVEDDDEEEGDEEEEEDDEEEEDAPKSKGKKKVAKEEADDDEDDDEEEDDEEDTEQVAVSIGGKVRVKLKSGEVSGKVVDILEDDNAIRVELKDGRKVKVSAEKIVSTEDAPTPKKKGKK